MTSHKNTMSTDDTALTDSWLKLFRDEFSPHGFRAMRIEGEIPLDLNGHYHQMGPRNLSQCSNIILADALLRSVHIDNGKASCAVSVIEPKSGSHSVAENACDQHGTYNSLFKKTKYLIKGLAPVKNVASTNIIKWQDELVALYEVSLATTIRSHDAVLADHSAYRSVQETDFGGALKGAFTAHPHWCFATDPTNNARLNGCDDKASAGLGYGFGQRFSLTGTLLDIYQLSAEGQVECITTINLRRQCFGFVHDFVVTQDYLLFCIPPIDMGLKEIVKIACGASPISTPICRSELGSQLLLVPLNDVAAYRFIETDAFFALHFANGYQRDNRLVFDAVLSADSKIYHVLNHIHKVKGVAELEQLFGELYLNENDYGRLQRIELDLTNNQISMTKLTAESVEFPRINSRYQGYDYRYIYCLSHRLGEKKIKPWFAAIRKIDVKLNSSEFYLLPEHHYALEPIFVKKANSVNGDGEDLGYLLSCVLDSENNNSYLLILDAQNIRHGPLAKLHFDQPLPIAFHGNFFASN